MATTADDDPDWLKAGVAQGGTFDGTGRTEPDVSTCIVTGMACPDSNCGKC